MQSVTTTSADAQRRQEIEKLQAEIRSLQNQMDFVEILVQFWPWGNMAIRMERLQGNITGIELKIRQLQLAPSNKKPIPLNFPRFGVSTAWVAPKQQASLGA